jgi:uncharacterized tellurite resistance protein B-like protein
MEVNTNTNFQLGLIYFVHLLMNVDGRGDERERSAILAIKEEEQIPDSIFQEFEQYLSSHSEAGIYNRGVELLNLCTDEEKICAFVYLWRLAEADDSISHQEVHFLMKGVKLTNIDFEDMVLSSNLVRVQKSLREDHMS